MRLIAVRPEPLPASGPDLPVILGWLRRAGHEVTEVAGLGPEGPGLEPPDLLVGYGSGPDSLRALHVARALDVPTVLMAWSDAPGAAFADADRVLVPSEHLARQLRASHGVVAEVLPIPLPFGDAPEEARGFVGVVDPSPGQGGTVVARIAAVLAAARPDIPFLVVHGRDAGRAAASVAALTASLPEAAQAQILVSPPLDDAALFSITRLLLLPTIDADGCGRLAASAMRHGVPTVASDRGALPEMVGSGGIVLPLPPIVLADPRLLPGEAETGAWVAALTRLWDDAKAYGAAAAACRAAASRHDGEALRPRYETFFAESV